MLQLKPIVKRLIGTRFHQLYSGYRHCNIGFSQFGEDIHIKSFYDRLKFLKKIDVKTGIVVDIGSFRPVAFSNSYYFYKRGWKGINIDPSPGSKFVFDKTRPRDINVEVAIGLENGEGTFYVFDDAIFLNTLDAEAAEKTEKNFGVIPRRVSVPIQRLDSLFERFLGPEPFEILSIDAEGYDIEILKSNDFSRFRPRIVLIEVQSLTAELLIESPCYKYLSGYGYTLYSWINPNLFFVRNDSWIGDYPSDVHGENLSKP